MKTLWDFRKRTGKRLAEINLRLVAEYQEKNIEARGRGKSAMVGSDVDKIGAAFTYKHAGQILPFEQKVFYDIDEAMKWLAEEEEQPS